MPEFYPEHTPDVDGFTFYVARDTTRAPGWYIFGAEKYGRRPDGKGAYVMLCAWPNMPARKRFRYNGPVKRGWRLKREAMAVAVYLNTAAHRLPRRETELCPRACKDYVTHKAGPIKGAGFCVCYVVRFQHPQNVCHH